MAGDARMHWFWRGLIAAFAGLIAHGVCHCLFLPLGTAISWYYMAEPKLCWSAEPWLGAVGAGLLAYTVISGVPTLGVAFGAYGVLTRWLGPPTPDGELHCRRCDHILRGLSKPRCPECGQAI